MSKIIKAHSLTGRITDGLMLDSFKAVKRNRGAAGIDKVSIKMFEANLADNLRALMRDLKTGSFQPHPLRRHLIPKNETEFRPLGIPAVRDRVAQEVVRRLLNPIFEPLFHPSSFGFRQKRNCHMAIEAALELHDLGFGWVVDADIKGFFDNLSHRIIMQSVAERVADGNILDLVEKFLTSGVMDGGVFKPTSIGTPQGGVISPLLANIVLNYLDWQLHHAGYRFVRYADDFVVLCSTPLQAKEALAFVQQVLEQRLQLQLSLEKTKVTSYGKGYSFLGFILSRRSRRMRPKSLKKFKDKIREITCRKHNLDSALVEELNRVIRGTAQYFATWFFTARHSFNRLDCWIRMRLRCMKIKVKSRWHHLKLQNKVFDRLGLLRLEAFLLVARDRKSRYRPSSGAITAGSPGA
ncbi:MAG: group II intron reverse transcriptase/maturase [Verrucomicrobia bacterium]|nr:group II intron reverse transcriptase/maturase [Verrucomicrobiota bacterium]